MRTAAPIQKKNGPEPRSGQALGCALPAGSLRWLERTIRKQWKGYRKGLKQCQAELTEEAIHDARVEARRLLSSVELLAGFIPAALVKRLERGIKRQLDVFGGLRDTQVQLRLAAEMRQSFPAARPFCAYLRRREERLIKSTRREVKRIKVRRLGKLLAACRAEAEARRKKCAPEKAVARLLRSVGRAFARASQLRARIDPRDTATIHRTRVAFKKFRYMVETLMGFLPAPDRAYREAMHHYQTMMGDIQDAEVLQQTLEKYLQKQAAPEAAQLLRAEVLRRRQRLIETYLSAAGQMRGFWPGKGNERRAGEAGARETAPDL